MGKHLALICFLSFVVMGTIRAQSFPLKSSSWQVMVGMNQSSIKRSKKDLNSKEGIRNDQGLGTSIGVGYVHVLSAIGTGELRLTYVRQRVRVKTFSGGHLFGSSNEFDLGTKWLNLAYLLAYQTNQKLALRLEGGPTLGYLLNGQKKMAVHRRLWSFQNVNGNTEQINMEQNETLFNSFMVGLHAGLHLLYPLSEYLGGSLSMSYHLGAHNKRAGLLLGEPMHLHTFTIFLGVQVLIK